MDIKMSEKTAAGDTPARGRRPNRQKLKKQITVRIDEDLLKAAMVRADSENLRLTDALESGLWLYLQQKAPSEQVRQVRFLCNLLPLRLQRLTLSFWSFIGGGPRTGLEELYRQQLDTFLYGFRDDPSYEQGLHQLRGSQDCPANEAVS